MSKSNLTDDIFDFLDECGGYTDYNQKIEDVMEEFGLDKEIAESYVWDWAAGLNRMDRRNVLSSYDSNKIDKKSSKITSTYTTRHPNYCPHCTNMTLIEVEDGYYICDECGEEYTGYPAFEGGLKLTPIEGKTSMTPKTISRRDLEMLSKKALEVTSIEELNKIISPLLLHNKNKWLHYSELARGDEYSPAAIGKMISDDIYFELHDSNNDLITSKQYVAPYRKQEFVKQLQDELYNEASEVLQSPAFGFPLSEIADYLYVDVDLQNNIYRCEVRSELDYEGMVELATELNKIVEKYDSAAYFDMVTPGIMETYLMIDNIKDISSNQSISSSYIDDRYVGHSPSYYDKSLYEEPYEPESFSSYNSIEFSVEIYIDNTDGYELVDIKCSPLYDDEYEIQILDQTAVEEIILDELDSTIMNIVETDRFGTYKLSGTIDIYYDIDNMILENGIVVNESDIEINFWTKDESIQNLEIFRLD